MQSATLDRRTTTTKKRQRPQTKMDQITARRRNTDRRQKPEKTTQTADGSRRNILQTKTESTNDSSWTRIHISIHIYIYIYIYTVKSPKWAICTLSGPPLKIWNIYVIITHILFWLEVLSNGTVNPYMVDSKINLDLMHFVKVFILFFPKFLHFTI